jgi:hypothetical protein
MAPSKIANARYVYMSTTPRALRSAIEEWRRAHPAELKG